MNDDFNFISTFFGTNQSYTITNMDEGGLKKFKSAFTKLKKFVEKQVEDKAEENDGKKESITMPSIQLDLETNDLLLKHFTPHNMYYFGYYVAQYECENEKSEK